MQAQYFLLVVAIQSRHAYICLHSRSKSASHVYDTLLWTKDYLSFLKALGMVFTLNFSACHDGVAATYTGICEV